MKYLLTLDVGTTAVKAALFDENLKQCALDIREYQLQTPQPNWVELNPHLYWDGAVQCIRRAIEMAGIEPAKIATITCTTQGETLIPIDKDGNVLYNAIIWLDARAKLEAQMVSTQHTKQEFYAKTGIPEVSPYTPLCKQMWLKNNHPDIYEKVFKFLLVEDYLIYRLCGLAKTNPAVLCTSGYYDIQKNELWHGILQENGLDARKIPELQPCGSIVAPLNSAAAQELGLSIKTLVTTGAMDQVAAAIGAGNIRPGTVSESTGTCLCVAATVQSPELEKWSNVAIYCHAQQGLFLPIVVTQTAGMTLRWFRDEFCIDLHGEGDFARMDELAAAEPPCSRGLLLFPHLAGTEADPSLRGAFVGFGLNTSRGSFIRAILESTGYALKQAVAQIGLVPQQICSVGGGAKSLLWNQIKADICNAKICVTETNEAASMGAAILGGVACGAFESFAAACQMLKRGGTYYPQSKAVQQYENGYAKFANMHKQLKPLFGKAQTEEDC